MGLVLELNDVGAPLLRALFARISDAISWLLTTLIGRSLGLIFRGVRQVIKCCNEILEFALLVGVGSGSTY